MRKSSRKSIRMQLKAETKNNMRSYYNINTFSGNCFSIDAQIFVSQCHWIRINVSQVSILYKSIKIFVR